MSFPQFSEKLEQLEESLTVTAQQVDNPEPVAAHPEKLRDQIADNRALLEDLDMRMKALDTVRNTADELLNQAAMDDDSAKGEKCMLIHWVLHCMFMFSFWDLVYMYMYIVVISAFLEIFG